MNYAIDKFTGTLILAARATKYAQYVCPVCKKGVNLRKGKVIPHILLICPDMVRQTVKILFPEIPSLSKLLKLFQSDIWICAY